MSGIRGEPFRLFFPLAGLLAWLGVLPWFFFGMGWSHAWLGPYHALTMTQAFVGALTAGFLGTMIPRKTGTSPLSTWELVLIIGGLLAIPLGAFVDSLVASQVAYLVVLATLAQGVVRRVARSPRSVTLPPSLALLPVGLVAGAAGAALLIASTRGAPRWTLAMGRIVVEEGLFLGLVMAVAPMLTPILCHGHEGSDSPGSRRGLLILHAAAGMAFLVSFVVQYTVTVPAGLFLRGAVVAGELFFAARAYRWPTLPGLHRHLYRLALLLTPVGLFAAGLAPPLRTSMMHVTFVGGLSLLAFAVSAHVTFIHTGRPELARANPWPLWAIGGLTLAGAAFRVTAERFDHSYVTALTLAATLWLLGALLWAVYLTTLITLRRPIQPSLPLDGEAHPT
jgi:uncharacterized protein involved in response to NO